MSCHDSSYMYGPGVWCLVMIVHTCMAQAWHVLFCIAFALPVFVFLLFFVVVFVIVFWVFRFLLYVFILFCFALFVFWLFVVCLFVCFCFCFFVGWRGVLESSSWISVFSFVSWYFKTVGKIETNIQSYYTKTS